MAKLTHAEHAASLAVTGPPLLVTAADPAPHAARPARTGRTAFPNP